VDAVHNMRRDPEAERRDEPPQQEFDHDFASCLTLT
jgi:hypothetical protein